MTPLPRLRQRNENGTALIEVSWLAILLLVPLLYTVLAVFEVQRSAFAVSAAARAAGRAYSIAPSEAVAMGRAQAAAEVALQDQGVEVRRSQVRHNLSARAWQLPRARIGHRG